MSDMSAMAAEAPAAQAPVGDTDPEQQRGEKPRSLFNDALRDLRRNPMFWVAVVLGLVVIAMAAFPQLFTSADPKSCSLSRQHDGPTGSAFFGFDFQGCDVYARTVYGAQASVLAGSFGVLIATALALLIGMPAGFFGGVTDAVLSRIIDIVLGVPYLLAGIVLAKRLTAGRENPGIWPVVLVLGILGWTTAARVVRSSVISAKEQDYVAAARMLGASNWRIMWRHILPNTLAPMVVVLTIALGVFIAAEATLSFLGIGLRPPSISWGIDIATATQHVRESAIPLLAPAGFLALTVLAFIMLGDAIRDAFDPRLR
jgi:peptide/nickel transport system permease protein/oligopeptide transport system permease protein